MSEQTYVQEGEETPWSEEDVKAFFEAEPADEVSPVKVKTGPAKIERDNIGREDQKWHEDQARKRDGTA